MDDREHDRRLDEHADDRRQRRPGTGIDERPSSNATMGAHLTKRREVDLEQHGNDHQPDEDGDRDIYLSDRRRADGAKRSGNRLSENDASDNTERDPNAEITFEAPHSGCGFRLLANSRTHVFAHLRPLPQEQFFTDAERPASFSSRVTPTGSSSSKGATA